MFAMALLQKINKRRNSTAILCAYKPPSVDNTIFSKELSIMLR